MNIARFTGDPVGYRGGFKVPKNVAHPLWVEAELGYSGRAVWIDLSKAYLVEPENTQTRGGTAAL